MNSMSYRGYTARIDFDDRDGIFVGKVLGIHAMIQFHGESVPELRADFESAIDFFIQDCEQRGIAPEKPASGKIMLRLTPDIHAASLIAAQAEGISLNQWAGKAISQALSHC
jgi:predicted HicB family RNase H-like nuclease